MTAAAHSNIKDNNFSHNCHSDHHSYNRHRSPIHEHTIFPTSAYDSDELLPHHSPLMKAHRPKLEPSPTPPPEIHPDQVQTSSGVDVLVAFLGNGRRPEIARAAARQPFPCDPENSCKATREEILLSQDHLKPPVLEGAKITTTRNLTHMATDHGTGTEAWKPTSPPIEPSSSCEQSTRHSLTVLGSPDLQHLAAGALQAVVADHPARLNVNFANELSVGTRQLSIHDDKPLGISAASPMGIPTPASGDLPPMQHLSGGSPLCDGDGPKLPSIHSTLGDFKRLVSELKLTTDKDVAFGAHPGSAFRLSSPVISARLPPITNSHVSPPISPADPYQRALPSPRSLPPTTPSPHYLGGVNQPKFKYRKELVNEGIVMDNSPPIAISPTLSATERMSIDEITNSQIGFFTCSVPGCSALPFQTQYLLNSHANVHSSARPHYCPVRGCPRSEGGKGFKRKNEMIRHGLVHDSPGYICPFCPDREHRYPRPDNLQRHVRVHHIDKDRDDPLLREVLAQRPDGPSRGRRRRG